MSGKTTKQHRAEILGCLRSHRPAFATVSATRGSRWWAAAMELRDRGMCRVVPASAQQGTEWACIPYGTTLTLATREVIKPAPAGVSHREQLPAVGDEVWFVFHGLVCRGRVLRVEKPGRPMAYACVFVRFGDLKIGGETCLHGRSPRKPDEGNHWYWSEQDAWNIVAIELEREAKRLEPQLDC